MSKGKDKVQRVFTIREMDEACKEVSKMDTELKIKDYFQMDMRCLNQHWPNHIIEQEQEQLWVWLFLPSHHCMCRAIIYLDEPERIFLDHLYVSPQSRMKGIGKYLQELREDLGRFLGCTHSLLYVKRDSWMDQWYSRRGYCFHSDEVEGHPDSYWKIKEL